jgi:putative heme-binding domain-containing protein
MLDVLDHPSDKHVSYAITCALGSHTLRRHWEDNPNYNIAHLLRKASRSQELKEPTPNAQQAEFDSQKNLKVVKISCVPERMRYTVDQFAVTVGQPLKIIFTNPDATDHNLVVVKPGALEEVGMAANEMARDPRNANSNFIPKEKRSLILEASPMIGPTRKSLVHVLRFNAPTEPGIYPFVCTFPGHWVIMKGDLVVAEELADVASMLAARTPSIVKEWKMDDFSELQLKQDEQTVMRGMQAFVKARCNQCHVVKGHGVNLGPNLTDVAKQYKDAKLLQQLLEPSSEINKKYQNYQFLMADGKVISGVIVKDEPNELHVVTNLLVPIAVTRVRKKDIDEQITSKISPMPNGLANVLTHEEIVNLLSFLQAGGYNVPEHLQKKHQHD